jgi:hypothetical protein
MLLRVRVQVPVPVPVPMPVPAGEIPELHSWLLHSWLLLASQRPFDSASN